MATRLIMNKGLIHVYTGDGKGKTSAAFGLALRAAGHGRKVLVLQFLKSGIRKMGELTSARKCGIRVIKFRDQISPIFDPSIKKTDLKKTIRQAIAISIEKIQSDAFDLIIMEEFNNAAGNGYVALSDIRKILKAKPDRLELVFTGRNAPKALIDAADYVTEMKAVKHPAENGTQARPGIEY